MGLGSREAQPHRDFQIDPKAARFGVIQRLGLGLSQLDSRTGATRAGTCSSSARSELPTDSSGCRRSGHFSIATPASRDDESGHGDAVSGPSHKNYSVSIREQTE